MFKLKTILSQRKIVNSAHKYTNEYLLCTTSLHEVEVNIMTVVILL